MRTSRLAQASSELAQLTAAGVGNLARRRADQLLKRDLYARPLELERDKVALLFFEDVERDTFIKNDRQLRRALRRAYHVLRDGQNVSGFQVAFLGLVRGLEKLGWRVIVNDPELARRNPHYPVGLAGYTHVLESWTLPNPAVLGPGLFDHPQLAPTLMRDPRYRRYLVPCSWMKQMFAQSYGDACALWFSGLDLEKWPDLTHGPKDLDLLVYDKIRWQREHYVPALLEPLLAELDRRGLRHETIRYRHYDHAQYRSLLARAKGMVFVCEHETQGLAYQEALACGVPVLAWDNGFWLDPIRPQFEKEPVPASSVPFFDETCGTTFRDASAFPEALDRFQAALPNYRPRAFVTRELSLEASGALYVAAYREAATAMSQS
ncbi:MAG: glycosyltransferase [Deltaproteobacteria bacterium]|nr:glycosyltransferase [Deltaproteobacteria bacterium]